MRTRNITIGLLGCLLAVCLNVAPLAAEEPSPIDRSAVPPRPLTSFAGSPIGSAAFRISDQSVDAVHPSVAYNSTRREYLVVWHNDRPGNDDIQAQRLSATGARMGAAFYISAGPGAERRFADVAYNSADDEYLVTWVHNDGMWDSIMARRVSGTGQVLGTAEIAITSPTNLSTPAAPAVAYASTANRYLVVWSEVFHPTVAQSIRGQVISPVGGLEGASFAISEGSEVRRAPDIAYNRGRNEYLVVWQIQAGGQPKDIHARRVTGTGQPLQPAAIEVARYTADSTSPAVAAIATAGADGVYLVAWQLQYAPGDSDVYAREVRGDGTVSPVVQLASSGANEVSPCVAGSESGGQFLVPWAEQAGGLPTLTSPIMARTQAATTALAGAPASVGGSSAANPDAIAGPGGDFLVAFDDATPGASNRDVYGRLWGGRTYLPIGLRNWR